MTDNTAFPKEGSLPSQEKRRGRPRAVQQRERGMYRLSTLGEMTGGIVHDFRNLLTIIESGLRLAEIKADHPESVRNYIAAAREGVNRGVELTSQLLTFANYEELHLNARNLNELINSFKPILNYGRGTNIRVRFALGADVPDCLADPSLFAAALLNLMLNARDSMPSGGEISVTTERFVQTNIAINEPPPGAYARLRVKDQGCGIEPDLLLKVMDPFFTTKGENGTGMGLAQVHATMQLVGGHLRIGSEPGLGTEVDLLFPSL
ncbi:nitrogen regulation protein NR(II) [Neorhizobium sp. T25_13]|uniref:two-component system sensor histidine kinase NtrB n=1 Tax=Neorhizobium sp. T25_13 TaxID=2093830 RepID=UPI000CF8632E|nr:ATP-binding protein [Neorhizobium sp. T25_13]